MREFLVSIILLLFACHVFGSSLARSPQEGTDLGSTADLKALKTELETLRLLVSRLQEKVDTAEASQEKRKISKIPASELEFPSNLNENQGSPKTEDEAVPIELSGTSDQTEETHHDTTVSDTILSNEDTTKKTSTTVTTTTSDSKNNSENKLNTPVPEKPLDQEWTTIYNTNGPEFLPGYGPVILSQIPNIPNVGWPNIPVVPNIGPNMPVVSSIENKMPVIPNIETKMEEPKVRLYTGPNLTGSSQDFNLDGNVQGSCLKVKDLSSVFESLDTFGTCVRLYNDPDCEGHSRAYYPRSTTESNSLDNAQQKIVKNVRAISRCFDNELDKSTSEVKKDENGAKTYQKKTAKNGQPFIPDLVYLGLGNNFKFASQHPIQWYRTGYGDRVEMIRAAVTLGEVIHGQTVPYQILRNEQKFYNQLQKEEGDQLGYFLSPIFGPQHSLPFRNIFPQNPQNRRMMNKMESDLVEVLTSAPNEVNRVRVNMNVDYENGTSTRPMGMSCVMNYGGGVRRMIYFSNMLPSINYIGPK